MNNAYQNRYRDMEPVDDRLDIFFREIELAIKWQRPSILLAVYPSEDIRAEAEAALENKVIGCGQKVIHIRSRDGRSSDISLFVARIPDADKVVFFVDGLSSSGEKEGFDTYRALNVSREYFVEKQIRIVFWLTQAEAVHLAHFAPDFWASRHRVIDFIESQKPDDTFIRALESAWQGQGEYRHMTDNLIDTHAKISLRETTQAGLPEWDGSTTAGVNLLLTLGIMHWRKGDHDKADESLRSALDIAIKTQDKRLEAVCFNAIALVKTDLGMLDEAVEAYEQAIELAPEKTFIWGHLGNLYSQLGLHQEAVEAFLNTLEHNPVDAIVWNSLGNAYVATDRAEDAIDSYRKAIELNDRFAEPWMSLGSLFKNQNLDGDAIKAYQRVTRIDAKNAQAWNELGVIYFEQGAFDEAIEAYNIALQLGIEAGWSYCNLASAYAMKDEFASAIPFYHKSIELLESDGDKAIAWNRLGDAYRQVKDYDNAISAYQKADKLVDANGSLPGNQLSYLSSLIAGERIINELSTDILEQVREMTAAEDAAPGTENEVEEQTQPEDAIDTEESVETSDDNPQAPEQPAAPEAVEESPAAEQVLEAVEEVPAAEQAVEAEEPAAVEEPVQETPVVESVVAEAELPVDDPAQAEEPAVVEDPAPEEIAPASEIVEPAAIDEASTESAEPVPAEEVAQETAATDVPTTPASVSAEDAPAIQEQEQEPLPEVDLRNAHIWNELGNIYFKVAAYDEALDAYNKAIELGLQVGLLYSNLGFACAHKGKFAEAVPLYIKSIELLTDDDDRAVSWGRLGEAYRQMNELAGAIWAYEKALELDPENATFAESLDEVREKSGDIEDVTETVDIQAGQPEAEQPALEVVAAAEVDEDDQEAALTAEEDESDDEVAAGVVSRIFDEEAVPEALSTGGDAVPAEEAPVAENVEEAVSPEPASAADEPAQVEPVATVEETAAEEQGAADPVAAPEEVVENAAPVNNLSGMREIDLKNAHIWNELGNIFARANAFDDAIDAYNKAIELEPDFGWPYSNLALVHTQKGLFGEAVPLYQKSVELFANKKDKAVSWNRLGDAYRQLNEYDNAIAAYQIADELNQDENVPQHDLRQVGINQASPIFSYLDGAPNDRF